MRGLKALLKDFVQQVYNPSKGKCKDADLVENIDRSWSGRGKRTGKPLYYTDYYVYAVDTESVADMDEQHTTRVSIDMEDDEWGSDTMDANCLLFEDSEKTEHSSHLALKSSKEGDVL